MYSLNKLESYIRISALGPVGHCTSHFKRAVCISCRPCVDVHKGEGGSGPCGRMWTGEGGQKRDFFVDVINGWPLMEVDEGRQRRWRLIKIQNTSIISVCLSPPKFKLRRDSAGSCFVRSHKDYLTYYNFESAIIVKLQFPYAF